MMPIFPSSSSPIHFEDSNVEDYCISTADVNKCSEIEDTSDDIDSSDPLTHNINLGDVVSSCEKEENSITYNNNYNFKTIKDELLEDFATENIEPTFR